jgi:hypothetical protein
MELTRQDALIQPQGKYAYLAEKDLNVGKEHHIDIF